MAVEIQTARRTAAAHPVGGSAPQHVVLVGDYPQTPDRIMGGVEAVVLYLSQALQRDPELRVSVVTLDRHSATGRTAKHGAVDVYYVPASTQPGRLSVHANTQNLRNQVIRLRPDLVHAHGTAEYGRAAAETGLPWVLTVHGIRHREVALRRGLVNRYRSWIVGRDERELLRRATNVIAISPEVETVFGRGLAAKVHFIDNPIADAFFAIPDRRQPGRILFVGRLTPLKDVMTLLHAFAELHTHLPAAQLRLAGDGTIAGELSPYARDLHRFVAESGLEESVTFLGPLEDTALHAEYAACAVVALSSKTENAPMAITQAMAAGKPVVSTDAGGTRHVVTPGETGWIVPVQDHRALSAALRRVLEDEVEAVAMGRRAKTQAEQRFRAAVVAEQTKAVYEIAKSYG